MARITEKDFEYYISNRLPFKGSSAWAILENDSYQVFSYQTKMYDDKEKYFDNTFYSTTTSKIQNAIIRATGVNSGIEKRWK